MIFQTLAKIEALWFLWDLFKFEDFSNSGKKWRFFKIWSKLKIFQILAKLKQCDFCVICWNWKIFQMEKLKILKYSQNWKFFNFGITDDFSNFCKIENFSILCDFWYQKSHKIYNWILFSNFGNKWRFFKIWSKLKIQILSKIDDFSTSLAWRGGGSYAGIWTPQSYGHPKYWWGSMLLT